MMPSSSARCAQLPKAQDKVPFYLALKKLRDHLRGDLPHLDDSEVSFPDLELKVIKKEERAAMEAEARKLAMAEIGLDETGTMPLENSAANMGMPPPDMGFNQQGEPMHPGQMPPGCDDIFSPYAQMNFKHGLPPNMENCGGVQIKQENRMDNQNYGQMPETFQMQQQQMQHQQQQQMQQQQQQQMQQQQQQEQQMQQQQQEQHRQQPQQQQKEDGNMGYNPLQQLSQGIVQIDGFSNNSEQQQNGQSTNPPVQAPPPQQQQPSVAPQVTGPTESTEKNGETINRPSSAAGSEPTQHSSATTDGNRSVPQSPNQSIVANQSQSPVAAASSEKRPESSSPHARSPAASSPRGYSQAVVPVSSSQGSPQGHAFTPVSPSNSSSNSQLLPRPPPHFSESHQSHYLPNQQGFLAHSHFSHPQGQMAQSHMQFSQPGRGAHMMSAAAQSFQFNPQQSAAAAAQAQFMQYAHGAPGGQFSQAQMQFMHQSSAQAQIAAQMSLAAQGSSHFSQGPYFQFSSSSSMSVSASSSSSQVMMPSPGNQLQMLSPVGMPGMPGVNGAYQVKSEPGVGGGGGGGCQYSQL